MQPRRVVVTGLGVVSPNGLGAEGVWKNLLAGVSGIGPITSFDTSVHAVKIAAEVKGWDPTHYMDGREAHRLDRAAQFAMVATDEACTQALIGRDHSGKFDPERTGCVLSSGIGGILTLEDAAIQFTEKGPRRVSPFLIPRLIINT